MGIDPPADQSVVKPILMPPEALPIVSDKGMLELAIKKFDVTISDLIKSKVHYCWSGEYFGRFIFPSFDANGNLNYFVTRTFNDDSWCKYLNCERSPKDVIFNELFIDWNKPLILTESIKTHVKMIDYQNYIPNLGSSFHKKSYLLSEMIMNGAKEIILMFDLSAKSDTILAAKRLLSFGFTVKIVENLMGADQPDKLSCDEIIACKTKAVEVDNFKLLKLKIQKELNG